MKKTTLAALSLALALTAAMAAPPPTTFILPLGKNDAQPETRKYKLPALKDPASWSFVLLPDIQAYVKYPENNGILDIMTAWIASNIRNLNIQFALAAGDIANTNDFLSYEFRQTPFGIRIETPPEMQYQAAARAFARLDCRLPYILCTGNHDYGYSSSKGSVAKGYTASGGGAQNRNTRFNDHFPISKNTAGLPHLRELALNASERPSLENTVYEFLPPNGMKILVIALEFLPRDEVLGWARAICDSPRYENHTVILLTHLYLNSHNKGSTRIEGGKSDLPNPNFGEDIWQKLVKPSKNIRLVISGHIGVSMEIDDNIGFSTDKNDAGKRVYQMVFNAHTIGGGHGGNGGDGWLRYLEFLPDNKTVIVKTYSPFFGLSIPTRELAWRDGSRDEFTFTLD